MRILWMQVKNESAMAEALMRASPKRVQNERHFYSCVTYVHDWSKERAKVCISPRWGDEQKITRVYFELVTYA